MTDVVSVNGIKFYNSDVEGVVNEVEDDNFTTEDNYNEYYDYPSGEYDDTEEERDYGNNSVQAIEDDDEEYDEDSYEEDDFYEGDVDNEEVKESLNNAIEKYDLESQEKSIDDEDVNTLRARKEFHPIGSAKILANRIKTKLSSTQRDTIIWAKNHYINSVMDAVLNRSEENSMLFIKQIDAASEMFCDQMRLANVKYDDLSREDYEFLGFHSWKIDIPGEYFNKTIMLIPIDLVKLIDAATEVYSITGQKVPFRPEELSLETRGGCLGYGFLLR